MKYWEYTKEQLMALSTKRLLSLIKAVRKQIPNFEECTSCHLHDTDLCPCQEEEQISRIRWDDTMDTLRSILSEREHIVRK